MMLMFFITSQKINNLLLKTNDIFNYKICIIGLLIYLIIFIFIKSPLVNKLNWNNWMLFILFTVFLLIDGLLIGYDYINVIKKLEKTNEQLNKPVVESLDEPKKLNENIDYETTTDLETTQEE
jgi:hypothetical protein